MSDSAFRTERVTFPGREGTPATRDSDSPVQRATQSLHADSVPPVMGRYRALSDAPTATVALANGTEDDEDCRWPQLAVQAHPGSVDAASYRPHSLPPSPALLTPQLSTPTTSSPLNDAHDTPNWDHFRWTEWSDNTRFSPVALPDPVAPHEIDVEIDLFPGTDFSQPQEESDSKFSSPTWRTARQLSTPPLRVAVSDPTLSPTQQAPAWEMTQYRASSPSPPAQLPYQTHMSPLDPRMLPPWSHASSTARHQTTPAIRFRPYPEPRMFRAPAEAALWQYPGADDLQSSPAYGCGPYPSDAISYARDIHPAMTDAPAAPNFPIASHYPAVPDFPAVPNYPTADFDPWRMSDPQHAYEAYPRHGYSYPTGDAYPGPSSHPRLVAQSPGSKAAKYAHSGSRNN